MALWKRARIDLDIAADCLRAFVHLDGTDSQQHVGGMLVAEFLHLIRGTLAKT